MHGNRRYRWEEWFVKPEIVLRRGEHYTCSQSSMVQAVRNAASLRGKKVSVKDGGDHVVVTVSLSQEIGAGEIW